MLTLLSLTVVQGFLFSQTIAEKKQGMTKGAGADLDKEAQAILSKVNLDLMEYHRQLKELYAQVMYLHAQNAPQNQYQDLLRQINAVRAEIIETENRWRDTATAGSALEGYALWHQPETTLEQVIIDYGSQDYVYLMTPEIGAKKISISSNLPIPRASWNGMLEVILAQNGIGIRQINPFLRELFVIKDNSSNLNFITNQRKDLELLPRDLRIAYMLSPDPADVRRISLFMEKFANPNTTNLQLIGRDILIVAQVGEIQDLLKLYDFIASNKSGLEYKLVPLAKVRAEDMGKILSAVFDHVTGPRSLNDDSSLPTPNSLPITNDRMTIADVNGLKVIILKNLQQAIFLIGTHDEIQKAESMIKDVENQIGGRREKTLYWYTVKHADPEELAEILEKVYNAMIQANVGGPKQQAQQNTQARGGPNANPQLQNQNNTTNIDVVPQDNPLVDLDRAFLQNRLNDAAFYQEGDVLVNPAPITLTGNRPERPRGNNRNNFLVDFKTGAIVMVVEQDIIPQLLEMLRKLDVPAKMVQIEVLVFEKRVTEQTNYGLNLLRIGGAATNMGGNGVSFNDSIIGGITDFMFNHVKGNGLPAWNIIYEFLLSRDDLTINSNPSVVTTNQTAARIAIVDEISLNTGTYDVETVGGVTLKDSFTRAQYGITLEITPTIHWAEDDELGIAEGPNMISLETDVIYDTLAGDPTSIAARPVVTRRNVHNEVVIPDGQTLILGGLRSKTTEDIKDSIPFLGEIPCFGKLFSDTKLSDRSTEMFIFITPKIIADPCEDIEKIKLEQLTRRPGDLPDFLCMLNEARQAEQDRLFSQTLEILFGRPEVDYFHTQMGCWPDGYYDQFEWVRSCGGCPEGEYDGS